MERSFLQRLLKPMVEIRSGEVGTALMMFSYSFLAMTAYNMVQPITRSKFITAHGAENLPYVVLASIVLIALLMQGYSKLGTLMPGRWVIPVTQVAMVALLVSFWVLYEDPARADTAAGVPAVEASAMQGSVATALYWFGQIYAILLISQFWTLANLIFDPRQAKRLFGFIGAGASLGGVVGGSVAAFFVEQLGSRQLLLVSAVVLAACAIDVLIIISRTKGVELKGLESAGEERGVGGQEALRMLRESKHLQIISVVIALTSIGAGLVDQQLNMATQAFKGREATDAMTAVLGRVQVYTSAIGFVIQMFLTSRIQRFLGVGFALMLLPLGFGAMAVTILLNAALWAPMLARVMDKSLRYTVDKTSREILFLPLPDAIKNKAKPFVDVTADRFARALQGFFVLILISPWGLGLTWQQISYASLIIMAGWIAMVVVAKRAYSKAFRDSLERHDVQPAGLRLDVADLSTIETLMQELASPDEHRVLYAIEILESLEKRNLITPLLLHHESPAVRARALQALAGVKPEIAELWLPSIQRMISDESPEVRAAAVSAMANIRNEQVTDLIRPYLQDRDPRIATTAAVVLVRSGRHEDVAAGEEVLSRLASNTGDSTGAARKEVAAAVRQIPDPRFRQMLIPLLYDSNPDVAAEAMRSVRALDVSDQLFVPTLISLLRHRGLKSSARDVLVGYGDSVLDALAYFLRDPDEDIWVRRHIPATIARIPGQKSMDILIDALQEPDGFLRYKVVAGLEKLRREHPELTLRHEPIAALAIKEGFCYFNYLTLHSNLFHRAKLSTDALLARALQEKMARAVDRVYRLLGLIYPWKDIAAARYAIEHGDTRARASAFEYLDNLLKGPLRHRLMLLIEDLPHDEKVRRANVALKTRPREVDETLLQLMNDDDQVVAAAAIDVVEERKLWTLADDLEHVLAHRDAKDWYVFEAASWAIAAYHMPENKRRVLWLEPLPAVQLASRLRHVPLFASVSVDELVRLAAIGRQTRYERGRILYQEGAVPDQLQFLLDGVVTAKAGSQEAREIAPPAPLGFEQILEGSAMPETIRTADTTVCLALSGDEIRTLISENTELVQGLFRQLAGGPQAAEPRVMKSHAAAEAAKLPAGALKPIEKAFVLRQVPVFSEIAVDEMRHLAAIAREVSFGEGSPLFAKSDPPAMHIVLAGRISLESEEGEPPATAEAGDAVGVSETLAGLRIDQRALVERAGRALRIEREELFDLLGQRPELLRQMFSALFRGPAQRAVAVA